MPATAELQGRETMGSQRAGALPTLAPHGGEREGKGMPNFSLQVGVSKISESAEPLRTGVGRFNWETALRRGACSTEAAEVGLLEVASRVGVGSTALSARVLG